MPPFNATNAESLATLITEQVNKYVDMMRDCNGISDEPSSQYSQKLQEQAEVVTNACSKLQASVVEPSQWVGQAAWSYCDSVALSRVFEMNIHKLIEPEGEGATMECLTKSTGASPELISRIMRQCMNRSIFGQVEPGRYQHNRHSLRLLDENFGSLIHYLQVPVFRKASFSELPLYEYYHSVDTNRGQQFSRAMAGHYDSPLDKPIELIFPFRDVPAGSLVVDIGGGNGQQSIRLVSLYPQLSCVVQDHQSVVAVAEKASMLAETIASRITWEAHDYCAPQPQKGAAIYLLSYVLRDNTDAKCIRIIQAVAQARDPEKSTLLIHDFVDLPSGYDLHLLSVWAHVNTKPGYERTEWFYKPLRSEHRRDSVFTPTDSKKHEQRRKLLGPGLSVNKTHHIEIAINECLDELIHLIRSKYISSDAEIVPVDLARKLQYFLIILGKTFGNLQSDTDTDSCIKSIEEAFIMWAAALASGVGRLPQIPFIGPLFLPSSKDKRGFGRFMSK
ncbi:hypothetical protein IFR05_002392 [Cadophora sp. M221]|nr:hypothetical protein IFR05_002392 [Cadophora sp. M221]